MTGKLPAFLVLLFLPSKSPRIESSTNARWTLLSRRFFAHDDSDVYIARDIFFRYATIKVRDDNSSHRSNDRAVHLDSCRQWPISSTGTRTMLAIIRGPPRVLRGSRETARHHRPRRHLLPRKNPQLAFKTRRIRNFIIYIFEIYYRACAEGPRVFRRDPSSPSPSVSPSRPRILSRRSA